MLQLHFPSASLETSECAPIFADVLKRRLSAGLWLHIRIHIHTVCTYLREVQLVQKDCRKTLPSRFIVGLWGGIHQTVDSPTKPGKDQIGRRVTRVSKVAHLGSTNIYANISNMMCLGTDRETLSRVLGHPAVTSSARGSNKQERAHHHRTSRGYGQGAQWALK